MQKTTLRKLSHTSSFRHRISFRLYLSLALILLMLFSCSSFPKNTENNRSLNVQLIWNITNISSFTNPSMEEPPHISSPLMGEGEKFSIKASYDDIVKAGVTTVVLKAEANGNTIKEQSFPVDAKHGTLTGLPSDIITVTAEARDKDNKALFTGTEKADVTNSDVTFIKIAMTETPEYLASKPKPSSVPVPLQPTPTPKPKQTIAPTPVAQPLPTSQNNSISEADLANIEKVEITNKPITNQIFKVGKTVYFDIQFVRAIKQLLNLQI